MPLRPRSWEGGLKQGLVSQETCHRVVRPEAGKSLSGREGLKPLL